MLVKLLITNKLLVLNCNYHDNKSAKAWFSWLGQRGNNATFLMTVAFWGWLATLNRPFYSYELKKGTLAYELPSGWDSLCFHINLFQGCQPPESSNIEDCHRWHHNIHDVIVTFDLIGLFPTNHIIAYITMVTLARMVCWGNGLILLSMLTRKINSSSNAKYMKIYCCESRVSQEMANSGDYPGDFRL